MKIRNRLMIVFSSIFILGLVGTSFVVFQFIENSIIEQEIEEMKDSLSIRTTQVTMLHDRASEDLVFALKNPVFVEYFELPESKNNVFKDGTLQFTESQKEIQTELEEWIFNFQQKFTVDETCLIDQTGQEHARLVLTQIAPDEELSSEEKKTPFFEPSFKKNRDEVHVQFPYVSPDTFRWVFAYTSPVVLDDGSKPAFYHFEMPLDIFDKLTETDHGEFFVFDPRGYVISNSNQKLENQNIEISFEEFFPSIDSVSSSPEFTQLFQRMIKEQDGTGVYTENGEVHYVVFQKLPTFDWIMIHEETKSLMMSEHDTVLGNFALTITSVSGLVIGVVVVATIIVSSKITRPIIELKNSASKMKGDSFDKPIQVNGSDEINELADALNKMSEKLKNSKKQSLQNERLKAIGELSARISHDIRNPLTTIKNEFQILKQANLVDENQTRRFDIAMKRITHQIDDVLEYVREVPLEFTRFDLSELLRRVREYVVIPSEVEINIPKQAIFITGDEHKIEIVLINLILNAIEAVENRGKINITILETSTEIIIEVQDSGPGVTAEPIEQVFDPLFSTKQKGTGLGLASVRNIVEQHHGTISVKNNPTIFTITIPKKEI